MNPLDAISLAAAVAQFTDFGVRLLSETLNVYKSVSGMTIEIVELKTIEDDLRQLSQSIQEKSLQLADPRKPLHESDRRLLQLCETCQSLSTELVTTVDRLRTRSTGTINLAVESFGVAVRKLKSQGDIIDLRRRVSEVREQMMLAMTAFLWEKSKSVVNNLDQLSRQQMEMISTLTRIDDATRTLNQTLIMFLQGSIPTDLRQREIIKTIWSPSWSPEQPIQDISRGNVKFLTEEAAENEAAYSKAILNSLFLEDLSYREEAIPEAYKSTFQWLFKSPRSDTHGHPLWSDFRTWLTSKGDIYWITGKPGSGKSTLMKFITDHSVLQELLAQWSEPKPLITARFYFWNAGTPMQKTQEGLLRTLLHQCLTQRPQLIHKVCPRRWALLRVFGHEAETALPRWTLRELLESFAAFDPFLGHEFNLALFIDGLDEFDGNHNNLVEFIRLFHSRAGRKVCVSSRPWNVFQDAFMNSPGLRLDKLTAGDVRLYVQDNLDSSPAFREYKATLPQQTDEFLEMIITKAEGVFLWVYVVIRHVLEAFSEGDRWDEIYDMVNGLSDDLSKLYQSIWSTIKPDYIGQSSRLFRIHRAYIGSIDVNILWLADQTDTLQIDNHTVHEQQDLITQTMRRRLNSRTRGLLEISQSGHVDFLHRSVRDWIEYIWSDIIAKSGPTFDPNLCVLKAKTVNIPQGTNGFVLRPDWEELYECFIYAAKAHHIASNIPILVATLDHLDGKFQKPLLVESEGIIPFYEQMALHMKSVTKDKGPFEISFVGIAARFGVLEYVRDKVTASPQLLQHKPGEVSILANAILGPAYFANMPGGDVGTRLRRMRQSWVKHQGWHGDSYRRLSLIKFLLDCGVPKPSAVVPVNITRCPYDRAIREKARMPPIIMPDGERLDYWQTVAKLLKEHGFSRVGYFELKVKPRLLKLFY
ncbi:hypothetical protein EV127DRAFT_512657 [Xylaria flabelliformis]|nr:hypothetical protein EV127DRAFT_512657 [Xylaria flabelliformis]